MATETSIESVDQTGRREIYVDRMVCSVTSDRVDIKPARSVVVLPILTLLIGIACFLTIPLGPWSLSFGAQIALTLTAIILVPTSGMGIVYAFAGAHLVIDRRKQSAVLQQGYLGMGVGTQDVVPFWKFEKVCIEDVSPLDGRGNLDDFAQYEVSIRKISGKTIPVVTVTVLRSQAEEGMVRARAVAEAVAEMAGSSVSVADMRKPPAT